jgi:hypothetical protein
MKRLMLVLLVALVPAPAADEFLWRAPRKASMQEWTCGFEGCNKQPVGPFRFLKEDSQGTTPKVTVRDANNREWSVKFGAEVIPECFGYRFVTAVGYTAEPTYFVANGQLTHAKGLVRSKRIIKADGTFARARFQIRGEKDFEFLDKSAWGWNDNRFRGTQELAGLRIVMMLLSNWDAKDSRNRSGANTAIFRVTRNGETALLYSVFDWGASLGRWGGALRRDQSDCGGFLADTPEFVKGVRGNEVVWGFSGKHGGEMKAGVTVDDVRWLLPNLQRITPEELEAGLKASGATQRQASCWTRGLEDRIRQLREISAKAKP